MVQLIPTDQELAELVRTTAPAVFIEVAYHDNPQDAEWIENNTPAIADAIVHGIADYFALPYTGDDTFPVGRVNVSSGTLNVRASPGTNSRIVGTLQNGDLVLILQSLPGWDYVRAGSASGYVSSQYIERING